MVRPAQDAEVLGWASLRLERLTLDDETVYLVIREGEIADLANARVARQQERSLWTLDARLIRMRHAGGPRGAIELEWREDKLWLKAGKRRKFRELEAPARPYAEPDVLICVREFAENEPIELAIVDTDQARVQSISLEYTGKFEFERNEETLVVDAFESTALDGCTMFAHERKIEQVDFAKQPIVLVKAAVDPEQVRQAVAGNKKLLAAFLSKARGSWKLASSQLKNKDLGVSLRIPRKTDGNEGAVPLAVQRPEERLAYDDFGVPQRSLGRIEVVSLILAQPLEHRSPFALASQLESPKAEHRHAQK